MELALKYLVPTQPKFVVEVDLGRAKAEARPRAALGAPSATLAAAAAGATAGGAGVSQSR